MTSIGRLVLFLDYFSTYSGYVLRNGGDGGPNAVSATNSGHRLPDTAYWAPGRRPARTVFRPS